jgi:hypothetical protein
MLNTLGERGLENSRDPYEVYAASHRILAVCRSLALGCTRRYLALFGPRSCWVGVARVVPIVSFCPAGKRAGEEDGGRLGNR